MITPLILPRGVKRFQSPQFTQRNFLQLLIIFNSSRVKGINTWSLIQIALDAVGTVMYQVSLKFSHSNFLINVWIYGLLPKSRIATGKKTDCMNKVLFGCMRFVCFTMADSHTQKFHPRNSLSMTGYSTMKDNFNLLGTCWTNSSWCTCLCPTRPICFSKSHCFCVR